MKLTQIYQAIKEAEEVNAEKDEFSEFIDVIQQIEKHAKERKVLEPDYGRDDLIDDIKREQPDIDDEKTNKMADFVFGHLEEDASNYAAIPEEQAATAEELDIGDAVKITGNVEGKGQTGTIDSFGQDKRFVIVQIDGNLHSYHSSDVSFAAETDTDESEVAEAGAMPRMSQEELVLHRNTIKQMADKIAKLNSMYVVAKTKNDAEMIKKIKYALAKIASEKADINAHVTSRQDSQLAESTGKLKFRTRGQNIVDTMGNIVLECVSNKLAVDVATILNSGIFQKKKIAEGKAFSVEAFNAAVGKALMEAEGDSEGIPHLTKSLLKNILKGVGEEGAHSIVKSLEWGDGAAKELLELITKDLKKHVSVEESVKQRLDPKCWKGRHKEGTKIKGGVRVNNCVPNESVAEGNDWGGALYDPALQKGKRKPTLSGVKVKFPPKEQGMGPNEFMGTLDSKGRFTKDTVKKMFGKLSPDAKGVAEGLKEKEYIVIASMGENDYELEFRAKTPEGALMQAKKWQKQNHIREVHFTVKEKGVTEGSAEEYKSHLIKTIPAMMKLLAKTGRGWSPSEEEMLAAVDTGYMVMKNTGDVKQAGKAMMDELNTLHRMSQGKQSVSEATSAAVRMQRAADKQRAKSDASLQRTPSSIPKKTKDVNHWYDAGVKDAHRGVKPNPRTYALKDPEPKHPDEVDYYMTGYKSVKQGVASNSRSTRTH